VKTSIASESIQGLTSSKRGVEELPNCRVGSVIDSTLALFGEGTRGLAGGVGASAFC
jgi:hypothetical protein